MIPIPIVEAVTAKQIHFNRYMTDNLNTGFFLNDIIKRKVTNLLIVIRGQKANPYNWKYF